MIRNATASAYTPGMKAIHWTTAAMVIALFFLGWAQTSDWNISDTTRRTLFGIHESFGITVLFLTAFRAFLRATRPIPPLPASLPRWEAVAARAVHWLFYALLILQPLAGWVLYSVSSEKNQFFGMVRIPDLPFLVRFENAQPVIDVLEDVHATVGFSLAVLFVVHVGAAFKHHFLARDDVLLRMAPAVLAPFLRGLRGER